MLHVGGGEHACLGAGCDLVPQKPGRADARVDPHALARPARGLGGAEQLIRIERLRLWDNKPFLAEEIALPLSPFAPLMELDITELGPLLYPVYEKVCGQIVASAEEFLTINEADAATARLLNCRRGAHTTARRSNGAARAVVEINSPTGSRSIEWRSLARGDHRQSAHRAASSTPARAPRPRARPNSTRLCVTTPG